MTRMKTRGIGLVTAALCALSTGAMIEGNRPARHWTAIEVRIAALTGKEFGVDTATCYLQN